VNSRPGRNTLPSGTFCLLYSVNPGGIRPMPIRFIVRDGLPVPIAVRRSYKDDDVLVVVDPTARAADLRRLARMLLSDDERAQLRRFLTQK
jgi:hypothetical protein